MFRNLIIIILIGIIIYLTINIYNKPGPVINKLTRQSISESISGSKNKEAPPHYQFINQDVFWHGELTGYRPVEGNKIKLIFKVNTKKSVPDTILVTEIENYQKFFQQNRYDMLWFRGTIVRIDPEKAGNEIVYVHGYINDGKFQH